MADEKPLRSSKEETCKNRYTSDINDDELAIKQKSRGIDNKAESRKSQRTGKKEHCRSDSDMDSKILMKMHSAATVRTADAVKGMTQKDTAENSTDSSDVDEDNSKERSSNTKNSYHSMSSTESEDSSTRAKTKTDEIKKTSANKRGNISDSNSDSSVSDDEKSKKDKKKEEKNVVS
jgi:hypothetical protein